MIEAQPKKWEHMRTPSVLPFQLKQTWPREAKAGVQWYNLPLPLFDGDTEIKRRTRPGDVEK